MTVVNGRQHFDDGEAMRVERFLPMISNIRLECQVRCGKKFVAKLSHSLHITFGRIAW